ncbi:YetF domain-containing protein [Ammoniphilus sp. 3BR4]|uniref:YetF domain-containing protein n=1 Tax=Ammoniphilus sp. 3BR4 TaxID=3158265 RepID=UPI00346544C2
MAFFETNGKLTVLKKPEKMSVTRKDVNLMSVSRGLPQIFIIDGKILKHSLAFIKKDEAWVNTVYKNMGLPKWMMW